MDVERDISRGEQVERGLPAMIERRYLKRVFEEGDRAEEDRELLERLGG